MDAWRRRNPKTRLLSKAKARSAVPYSAYVYVDRLPVSLRPLAVVRLVAKPQRTQNAYKKVNDYSKRIF